MLFHASQKDHTDTQRQEKSLYYATNKLRTTFAQRLTAVKNIFLHITCQFWCNYTQFNTKCICIAYSTVYQSSEFALHP